MASIPIKVGFCDNNGTRGIITLASSVSVNAQGVQEIVGLGEE